MQFNYDWKNMLKHNWGKILAGILFFILLIPLCINWIYEQNWGISFLQVQWKAPDALNFYGTLLASGIGIIGVFVSIQYAQKSYKDDLKHQVLPFFSIIQLKGISHYNVFRDLAAMASQKEQAGSESKVISNNTTSDKVVKPLYEELELKKVYFIIEKDKITCYKELNEYQQAVLDKAGYDIKEENGTIALKQLPYISSPLIADNVGNGAAICARIGFFKKGNTPEYLTPLQFRKGDRFYIHIFSTVPPDEVQGEYILSFVYQDIYKNKYAQNFPYTVTTKEYSLSLDVEQERM